MAKLDDTQVRLLCDLVEADRRLPRESRQHFLTSATMGAPGVDLIHDGLPSDYSRVFEGDLDTLSSAGFISLRYSGRDGKRFFITNRGYEYYEHIRAAAGQPVHAIEAEVRRFLESPRFQQAYPAAYQKWSEAASLLWGDDTHARATTIGHLLREASQEFATQFATRHLRSGPPNPRDKTKANIRAVFEAHFDGGGSEKRFLEALLEYWEKVIDLLQRQEHGAHREGEELWWEDSRRAVFQTAMVMYELDRVAVRWRAA